MLFFDDGGGSYLPAEMQSVYSTVPADWAICQKIKKNSNNIIAFLLKTVTADLFATDYSQVNENQ